MSLGMCRSGGIVLVGTGRKRAKLWLSRHMQLGGTLGCIHEEAHPRGIIS